MIDIPSRPSEFLGRSCAGVGHEWKPIELRIADAPVFECARCGVLFVDLKNQKPSESSDHPFIDTPGYRLFRVVCWFLLVVAIVAAISFVRGLL